MEQVSALRELGNLARIRLVTGCRGDEEVLHAVAWMRSISWGLDNARLRLASKDTACDIASFGDENLRVDGAIWQDTDDSRAIPASGPDSAFCVHAQAIPDARFKCGTVDEEPAVGDGAGVLELESARYLNASVCD